MIEQKLLGLLLFIIGVIVPFIEGDATASVIFIPLGLYAIFTREYILSYGGNQNVAKV